jgi:hypothetical protein
VKLLGLREHGDSFHFIHRIYDVLFAVKSVGADGVVVEVNAASEWQGFGRFPSVRGVMTITVVQGPNTSRSTGQGIGTTKEGEPIT